LPGKQNVSKNENNVVFVKEDIPDIPDIPIYITENRIAYIRVINVLIVIALIRILKKNIVIRSVNSCMIVLIPPPSVAIVIRNDPIEPKIIVRSPVILENIPDVVPINGAANMLNVSFIQNLKFSSVS
jgi:hypothetical protein